MKLPLRDLAQKAVIEESAEVTQVFMKIDRFGLYSKNPYTTDPDNLTLLAREVGDLYGALDMLRTEWPELDEEVINLHRATKREKLLKHNDGAKADLPFVFRDGKLYDFEGYCIGQITPEGALLAVERKG